LKVPNSIVAKLRQFENNLAKEKLQINEKENEERVQ